jgi:hypothetical protein
LEERVQVLKQVYDDVLTERDRLRDARAGFTSRLGPLPASAAIVIGLTGATADQVDRGWIAFAGVLFVLLVLVSTVYSGLAPYRLIRGPLQRKEDRWPGSPDVTSFAFGRDANNLAEWLEAKIALEERVCGELPSEQRFSLIRRPTNLQQALDVERSAFIVVQILFVAIILTVVLGVVVS